MLTAHKVRKEKRFKKKNRKKKELDEAVPELDALDMLAEATALEH